LRSKYSSKLFFLFLHCCARGTLWHLQKFLQCIKYIILKFSTPITLLYLLSPTPGTVSTSLIFPFTHMYMVFSPHSPPYKLLKSGFAKRREFFPRLYLEWTDQKGGNRTSKYKVNRLTSTCHRRWVLLRSEVTLLTLTDRSSFHVS
jgi:hypothetical protein